MAKVRLTFSKSINSIESKLMDNINNTLSFLKKEAEDRTPEDTKTLVGAYKVTPAKKIWLTIKWKLSNNTPYAFWVEFGTKTAKNYHKPKWSVFYTTWSYRWEVFRDIAGWIYWARMMSRAVDENRKQINILLSK